MRPQLRTFLAATVTVLAALLVWVALTTPNRLVELHPAAFVRLPLEALVYVALVLVVPARARTPVAVVAGVVLGVLTVLRVLDMAFFEALNRPFDVAVDWRYAALAGRRCCATRSGSTAGTVLLVVAAVVLVAPAGADPARPAARHPAAGAAPPDLAADRRRARRGLGGARDRRRCR